MTKPPRMMTIATLTGKLYHIVPTSIGLAVCGRHGDWKDARTINRTEWLGKPWPRVCETCRRLTAND